MEKTITLSKKEYDNLVSELSRLENIEYENSTLTVTRHSSGLYHNRNEVKVYKGSDALNEMQRLLNLRIAELNKLSYMGVFKFIKWKRYLDMTYAPV